MFEKEAKEFKEKTKKAIEDMLWAGGNPSLFANLDKIWKEAAEFGYDRAGEWHFIKDKLPPEPLVVGDKMFPKNYICAYSLNNEYNDYEIGDFLYYGNGVFNGENKDYPIYAWLEKTTVIPLPPKEE